MTTKRKPATKKTTTRKSGSKARAKKPAAKQAGGRTSALDAAAKVLGEAKQPLTTKEMVESMAAKGWWKSPGGRTPDRTLYSAILREIVTKGKDSRFVKTARGKFMLRKGG
jgi:HB1, ASXL, restriction endonuclease HTH domain